MRGVGVVGCALVAVALAAGAWARVAAPRESEVSSSERGVVVSVHDGDTITVRLEKGPEKVRLIGIQAPELNSERDDLRTLGYAARDYARGRVAGAAVTLVNDSRQPDRDKYGRLLRYVILEDGTNFNEELVRKGYARVYDRFQFDLKRAFKSAEEEARRERRPIWAMPLELPR